MLQEIPNTIKAIIFNATASELEKRNFQKITKSCKPAPFCQFLSVNPGSILANISASDALLLAVVSLISSIRPEKISGFGLTKSDFSWAVSEQFSIKSWIFRFFFRKFYLFLTPSPLKPTVTRLWLHATGCWHSFWRILILLSFSWRVGFWKSIFWKRGLFFMMPFK